MCPLLCEFTATNPEVQSRQLGCPEYYASLPELVPNPCSQALNSLAEFLLGWNQYVAIPTTTARPTNPLSALAKFPVATSFAFFLY